MRHREWIMGTMVERIQPVCPLNLLNNLVKVFGTKSEVAASPLPSQGPKRGWSCYVTPAFSGVPKEGDKIRSPNLR